MVFQFPTLTTGLSSSFQKNGYQLHSRIQLSYIPSTISVDTTKWPCGRDTTHLTGYSTVWVLPMPMPSTVGRLDHPLYTAEPCRHSLRSAWPPSPHSHSGTPSWGDNMKMRWETAHNRSSQIYHIPMYYTDMSHTRVLKHTFPRSGYMVAGGKLRLWHQPGEQLDSTGPTQKGARQPQWRYSQTLIILSTCSLAQSDPSAQAREGLASRLYLTRPHCKFFAAPIRLQKEL